MNVLFVNNYFPPEIGAASNLYYYLGKELINRGHKVSVLTGIPRYNVDLITYRKYHKTKPYIEFLDGIKIIRVPLPYVDRKNLFRRGIEHFEIAYKLYKNGKSYIDKDTDISLVYSPPLTLYFTAERFKKKYNIPYILNVQDIFPKNAIDLRILKNPFLIWIYEKIEKHAYIDSDLVTVHSESNAIWIKEKLNLFDSISKVKVVENWIDSRIIVPGSKNNPFSSKHELTNKFIVSFAGTLGLSQDLEIIVKSAKITVNLKIKYLIVGDGLQKQKISRLIYESNLRNIILLPSVSLEEYKYILWSSDISLVTLKKEVKTPVIPSKILSIMSAGIPVVGAMNLDGDAPKLIERAKAGIVVPAGDAEAFANAIVKLYKDAKLREEYGKNGRKYVEENLSVETAATKYEELFKEVIRNYRGKKHKN